MTRTRAILVVLALASAWGCGAIRQEPFKQFAASVQEVQSGSERPLGLAYSWTRERYLMDAASPKSRAPIELKLDRGSSPYAWTVAKNTVVSPWKVASFNTGIERLNAGLVKYGDLLAQLASDELVSPDRFEKLADDINANSKSAAKAIGANVSDDQAALFATAASAIAQQYILSKRKNLLIEALTKNQPQIQWAGELGQEATRGIADIMWEGYDAKSTQISRAFFSPNIGAGGRSEHVESLLDLDEKFIAELAILAALHDAYSKLPSAHAELAESLERSDSPLDQIRALYAEGRRLQRLYNDLRKPEEVAQAAQ